MDIVTLGLMFGAGGAPPGQVAWAVPGSYSFIVPDNVYSISGVVVGGGAGGGRPGTSVSTVYNGPSGALRWVDRVAVTPGEVLTIFVGAGGAGNFLTAGGAGGAGQQSSIKRGTTTLLYANGGTPAGSLVAATGTPMGTQADGSVVGGGNGSNPLSYPGNGSAIGGGGAPGYAAQGQQGAIAANSSSGTDGVTGGGGGGAAYSSYTGSGGGGVGLFGTGSNGTGGVIVNVGGTTGIYPLAGSGGSGGASGANGSGSGSGQSPKNSGSGGGCGAGGGSCGSNGNIGGDGGSGGIRIIWGYNRSYPSTNTQDV